MARSKLERGASDAGNGFSSSKKFFKDCTKLGRSCINLRCGDLKPRTILKYLISVFIACALSLWRCSVVSTLSKSATDMHGPWRLTHSGELRTQKLKSHLVRTQSLNVLPLKPGVGQHIAIHATLTARDFFLAYFYPSSPPQWGAADAEIKVPSGENTELKRSPFKARIWSVYSHTC